MNRTVKGLTLSAGILALTALPAQSQMGWGSLGLHTGWMNPAQHAEGPTEELGFDETFGIGASADLWFGQNRRWGLGAQGTWSGWNEWDTDFGGDFGHPVDIWQYDASLQFRLTQPTFESRFLPYIGVGVGGVTTNPDNDPDSPFPGEFCEFATDDVCDFTPADVRLTNERNTEIAAVGTIGTDWMLSPNLALRLEVQDYWTNDSPYRRISDGTIHDGGHNISLNAGLAFQLGAARVEQPGFVAEEPIIVEPEPEPEPEPVVVEETVSMCVIDSDNLQPRMIEAIHVPSENRTYVMRNGQRVMFETAYPANAPVYVRDARWYMTDQPLVIDLEPTNVEVVPSERNRIELVLFGSPATRNANDVVFVGTIDGTPVYADRTEIAPFRSDLEAELAVTTDLGTILVENEELASEFGEIRSYYVAVEQDCVFQPVSVTRHVRRTHG